MKSNLFSFKSITLFALVMLFTATGVAQNNAKAKNATDPCEDPIKVTLVKSTDQDANASAKNNAKTNAKTSTSNDTPPPPAVIIQSTNVDNSGESTVQYAKISVKNNSFTTKEVEIKDANTPHYVASPKPEYIYGRRALAEHILKNAHYPTNAKKDKAEGIVLVQVIVEKDGAFTNPQVIKSVHPLLDAEALRVVETLKCFIPGKVDKEPVRCYYQIPIAFEYKESKKQ